MLEIGSGASSTAGVLGYLTCIVRLPVPLDVLSLTFDSRFDTRDSRLLLFHFTVDGWLSDTMGLGDAGDCGSGLRGWRERDSVIAIVFVVAVLFVLMICSPNDANHSG